VADVTEVVAVIPSIPVRTQLLDRAVTSVRNQQRAVDRLVVAVDHNREGAARTRLRGLLGASGSDWVAFLDDDDEWLPSHVEVLLAAADETGADYVYSWFETVPGGRDPFPPFFFTDPWDDARPRHTTMTVMVRTELALRVGFTPPTDGATCGNEDWRFTLGCMAQGAKIHHVPQRTWLWHHDSGNTSGLPDRW
jgi:glycosyltransferase involved in cell wall biosynthesis